LGKGANVTADSEQASHALLSAALENSANAIVITDSSGVVQWVNRAATELAGYAAAEMIGNNPRMLKSGRHPTSLYEDLWNTILAGRPWSGRMSYERYIWDPGP
jgi:PAS domain S-box-containing protein